MRSSASWNELDSMITSTSVGSCVSYRSIIRRLSWCRAVAYARRRKLSRSVSNAYSALSLSSRRWCSSRSRSSSPSFCETSPTRASSLRMSLVSPLICCCSRASFWRAADSFDCTSPSEWPLSPAAGAASSRQPTARIAKRRAMKEGSAGRRTSLPPRLAVPSLRARLGDHGGLGLRDDRRLWRVSLVGRRIRLRDDGGSDRILLTRRRRLLRELHHLGGLNLQPAAAKPVLCLGVH